MKLREIRISRNKQQKELAKAVGTDEPMLSKFEHYKCLPIPSMMKDLCRELECEATDIYEPNEMYYQGGIKVSSSKTRKQSEVYHLTVNLPPEAREVFKNALKKCGYKDITYWVYRCFERLKAQYEIILKAEKKTSQTPPSE